MQRFENRLRIVFHFVKNRWPCHLLEQPVLSLHMHDVQFQLCEWDKHERVRLGEGKARMVGDLQGAFSSRMDGRSWRNSAPSGSVSWRRVIMYAVSLRGIRDVFSGRRISPVGAGLDSHHSHLLVRSSGFFGGQPRRSRSRSIQRLANTVLN